MSLSLSVYPHKYSNVAISPINNSTVAPAGEVKGRVVRCFELRVRGVPQWKSTCLAWVIALKTAKLKSIKFSEDMLKTTVRFFKLLFFLSYLFFSALFPSSHLLFCLTTLPCSKPNGQFQAWDQVFRSQVPLALIFRWSLRPPHTILGNTWWPEWWQPIGLHILSPIKEALFGGRIFAYVVENPEIRSFWIVNRWES